MWGPKLNPIIIDKETTLFEQAWNENFDTGNSMIGTVAGYSFGAALKGSFSGAIGSKVSLKGFNSGSIDVDYPVDIQLDMPTDNTYDQGDEVVIKTNYKIDTANAELLTIYPQTGEAKWGLYFRMAGGISAKLCAFACETFPIIPNFDTGLIDINLATANKDGIWFIGPVYATDIAQGYGFLTTGPQPLKSQGVFPFALPPKWTAPPLGDQIVPWQCYLSVFPVNIPDFGYGVTGDITIPEVITTNTFYPTSVNSRGESTYFKMDIEIFDLIGGILSNFKGPIGVAGKALTYLKGEQDLKVATVSWNFFSASFQANLTNKQSFDFNPKIYGSFEFPVPIDYQIIDNVTNQTSEWKSSSIINVKVGDDLRYKFPCFYESVAITPTYSIVGTIRNHTYDSISFDFLMSAFAFGFEIPAIQITPAIHIDAYCFDLPYPCPTWSKPWRWCTENVCTPEINIPAIGWDGLNESFGPLFEAKIPIGNIKYDWLDRTWDLDGFTDSTFSPFRMNANRLYATALTSDVLCYGGNNGAIDITLHNAKLPASYSWTNGAATEDISGLTAGPYEVTIFDDNLCQLFTGGTILEPQGPLEVSFTKTDKLCNGGINNGTIDVTVKGGTAPYSYLWNNSSIAQDISGLSTGNYSLTVKDANNCTSSISVDISEPAILDQFATITNVNCKNATDGAIAVDVFGGKLPYSFAWNSGQITEDIKGIGAGSYVLTITDANLCTSVKTHTLTEPATALNASVIGATNVSCFGGNNGAINITTTGGTANYAYKWSNSKGVVLPLQSENVSGLTAETYTLLVTDAKNCTFSLSQAITQPNAPLSSTPIVTNVNCYGAATGTIDPVISGGTAPYSYSWSNSTSATTAAGLVAGNYTLNVQDAKGCSAIYNYTVSQPNKALNVVLVGTNVICNGNNTGAIKTTVSGGTSNYSYTWSNGSVSKDVANLLAGNYNVLVTDAVGCKQTANITLTEPNAPLTASTNITDVDCYNNKTGAIDLTVTGGTTPYTYKWSNAQSVVLKDTTQDLSKLKANTYTVLITDKNNCTFTVNSIVNQPTAALVNTGIIDHANCFGLNDGSIITTTTGGTQPYSYSWSNSNLTKDITASAAGSYTVTVTDANNCKATGTYSITQPTAALTVYTDLSGVLCKGDATGKIATKVGGGTAPYTYAWSNGSTDNHIHHVVAGSYTLTVTDAQGCTAFTGATVPEPASALTFTPTVTNPTCYGYSDGKIMIAVTGGVQPYMLNWGDQNEIKLNHPSETIEKLTSGNYFVRVKDYNGCISEQTITMGQPTALITSTTQTNVACYSGATGSIDLTIQGATPNYTVTWSNGQLTEDVQNLIAGNYSYSVKDAQNCIVSNIVQITQNNELKIGSTTQENISCADQKDGAIKVNVIGGIEPYSYLWNNNETTDYIKGLSPGIYIVDIKDANQCAAQFSFEIYKNENECLDIPNTFTPNGDQYNDTWVLDNLDIYPNCEVKVFNRWGSMVYSSKGEYKPWDGTANHEPLPSAVYYYIIELKNSLDNKYTGTITIIR